MITIAGTGGAGKTRLALAVAQATLDSFPQGLWWVDLASLTGDGLVSAVVAGAVDVPETPGEDAAVGIARHLRARRSLLVLDNCEHVIDESAKLAERLLLDCRQLHILATSREVLGVTGEQVFRLGGLELPKGRAVGDSEAVQLFAERAGTALAHTRGAPSEERHVVELCRRLDGLPLAIELAAARVGTLAVSEIAGRLDLDTRLLRHPSRLAPPRHQTLEATLEWSYRLLTPTEQALFRRLSVFHGTFSLDAAEGLAERTGMDRWDVVAVLGGLVDKSLVQVGGRGAERRYRLLQTVRQTGEAKLAGTADATAVYRAHADLYLALAEQAQAGLEGRDQAHWIERLELEHDNFRAVLRRALPTDPETAGRLAARLWPFWYRRGYYHEARSWLEAAAARAEQLSPAVRAATLMGAGVLAFLQCDYEPAAERLRETLALAEELDDRVGVATALQRLGSVAREQARYADARQLHQASRAAWAELGEDAGVAASEDYLAFISWLEGDFAQAEERGERALAYFDAVGRRQEAAAALVNLGVAAHYAGDDGRAVRRLRRALVSSRQIGYLEGEAWSLHELGAITLSRDPEAPSLLAESLDGHVHLGDRWRVASVLETIAAGAIAANEVVAAAQLLGASDALRRHLGAPVPPAERPAVERTRLAAEESLGPIEFADRWEEGRAMSLAEAAETARQTTARCTAPPASTGQAGTYQLTDRELAVLRLVKEGLSNREIGQRLFISSGTAGVHVSNILRKLGVQSRVQAAGVAHEMGL